MSTRPVTPVAVGSAAEDGEWFEREVLAILPELYGTARRLCRNGPDSADLVAETIARGWTHLTALQDRSRFRAWLFRIMTNTFVSQCRSQGTASFESLEDDGERFSIFEPLHQPFLLWWGNPEQVFLDSLLREDLERAMDALPDVFRTTVVMADLQGLSYREISEALEIPVGTVRSRLARGRSLLQKALWDHAVDAGLVGHHKDEEAR